MLHTTSSFQKRATGAVVALTVALAGVAGPALAQRSGAGTAAPSATASAATDWSRQVWATASEGGRRAEDLAQTLTRVPGEAQAVAGAARARTGIELFRGGLEKREKTRAERKAEVGAELDAVLAKDAPTDVELSAALRSGVELAWLAQDKKAFFGEARTQDLIERAARAAAEAEARGDWLIASELFFRLESLTEETARFKKDAERQLRRLALLRLYAPERLWELRNARQLAEGKDPLPAYNPIADSWQDKVESIDRTMTVRALAYATRHVERTPVREVLYSGLDALKTMATTRDLEAVFPAFADAEARAAFGAAIDREKAALAQAGAPLDVGAWDALLTRVSEAAARTVRLPEQAVLHEFGNGAMSALDEFSAVIWPDELQRFRRSTEGKFVGVGVQIEYDDQSNIRVIAPLDGTPAQRAGVKPGDVLKAIDGKPAFGMSLDQAVEVITGPVNTEVVLTVLRKQEVEGEDREVDVVIPIARAVIDVGSVKGWRRSGAGENDWDYFIDPENRVGYVRLTQFTEDTSRDLDLAIAKMREAGLSGLILDLRFNPGGLLDQAVGVVSRFVDRGVVVTTRGQGGRVEQQERVLPQRASLAGVPVVVLVNEGSASASEIVAGALQDHAREGRVRAVVVGDRSYGKGSVQNVWPLGASAAIKVTTQYYVLPGGRLIHRHGGAAEWGVQPDLRVEMLPKQSAEAIKIRRDADILAGATGSPRSRGGGVGSFTMDDPERLLTDHIDLQLNAALAILQSQSVGSALARAESAPATVR